MMFPPPPDNSGPAPTPQQGVTSEQPSQEAPPTAGSFPYGVPMQPTPSTGMGVPSIPAATMPTTPTMPATQQIPQIPQAPFAPPTLAGGFMPPGAPIPIGMPPHMYPNMPPVMAPPPLAHSAPSANIRLSLLAIVGAIITLIVAASTPVALASARARAYPKPAISFTASDTQTNNGTFHVGDAIAFSISVQKGANLTFTWDFGDGAIGVGASVTHVFQQTGGAVVTLTATDPIGQTGTATQNINVLEPTPVASFTSTPDPYTACTIDFDASGSSGSNLVYGWNFGDGTTGTGQMTNNTYAQTGTYTVTLTVTDDTGQTATTSQPVSVQCSGLTPAASFTYATDPSNVCTIDFDATGSTGVNLSYAWDFGDGTTGTGATISNTYSANASPYTVMLTVTDQYGQTNSTQQTISVPC